MITINKPVSCDVISEYPCEVALDYRGLSTDTKPESAPNGSTFFEIDTGNVFGFDKGSGTWIAW